MEMLAEKEISVYQLGVTYVSVLTPVPDQYVDVYVMMQFHHVIVSSNAIHQYAQLSHATNVFLLEKLEHQREIVPPILLVVHHPRQ